MPKGSINEQLVCEVVLQFAVISVFYRLTQQYRSDFHTLDQLCLRMIGAVHLLAKWTVLAQLCRSRMVLLLFRLTVRQTCSRIQCGFIEERQLDLAVDAAWACNANCSNKIKALR